MFVVMWAETYANLKAEIASLTQQVHGLEEQIIMVQDVLTSTEKRADQSMLRADNAVDRLLVKRANVDPISPLQTSEPPSEPDPFEEDPAEVTRIVDAMRTFGPAAMSEGGANV